MADSVSFIHCSKQQGRTFHVTTAANSSGESVVQYFSGQTNTRQAYSWIKRLWRRWGILDRPWGQRKSFEGLLWYENWRRLVNGAKRWYRIKICIAIFHVLIIKNESRYKHYFTFNKSVSCSVRFEVFSCDSCFAGKNSGLLQIEIKVFSQFHRVCLLDSTIATCFRRIQAKFDRFYSNFRLQGPLPCAHIRYTEFRSHTLHTQ